MLILSDKYIYPFRLGNDFFSFELSKFEHSNIIVWYVSKLILWKCVTALHAYILSASVLSIYVTARVGTHALTNQTNMNKV